MGMIRLLFTFLVTFLVILSACAKKAERGQGTPPPPTTTEKLYGYWELESTSAKTDELAKVPGAMMLELNRNGLHEIAYCMADKSLRGSTGFSVLEDVLKYEVARVKEGEVFDVKMEKIEWKVTELTESHLQLDGKYNYRRIFPVDEKNALLSSKVSPYCAAD
jgi:hypothetical protein